MKTTFEAKKSLTKITITFEADDFELRAIRSDLRRLVIDDECDSVVADDLLTAITDAIDETD